MKIIVHILVCSICCFLLLPLQAQVGGRHVYDFLNLSPSARLISLGGFNVSTLDDDLNMAVQNPALANDSMHKHISLSFANYLLDIGHGYAGYSHTIDGIGSFHTGIHFVSYGQFQGADEFGNLTGEFSANELAWYAGIARSYKNFRYGANVKFISSTLADGFNSIGVAMDLGGAYTSKNKLFTAGLVFRNIGTQLTPYADGASGEPLPFDIVLGISNKLRYMPMRFSITLTNLDTPNLIFDDPDAPVELDFNGNPVDEGNQTLDNIFRHFVFSTEFLLGKAVRLRAGYNHLRRQELRLDDRGGFTGFSLGTGLRVKRFAFDYGFASYGVNNAFQTHQFSLWMDLDKKSK